MNVSVVIIVKNEAKYIRNCLSALFNQSYQDFEIVIVDNGSTDATQEIIKSFGDKRIQYFFKPNTVGVANLRNEGIKHARGKYIFFTDGDCVPSKYWLKEGLDVLEKRDFVGVEGLTYYENQEKETISDWSLKQYVPGGFTTSNIAYTRAVLDKVNYFDPKFKRGHEDRDLGFSAMKQGKIYFSRNMIVAHAKKKISIATLFNRAKRAQDIVYFIKKHGRRADMFGCILYPKRLLGIIFPPIILLTENYRSLHDLVLGFLTYFVYIYERVLIWKAALKNKILVI